MGMIADMYYLGTIRGSQVIRKSTILGEGVGGHSGWVSCVRGGLVISLLQSRKMCMLESSS